jgi:hypothetical protein
MKKTLYISPVLCFILIAFLIGLTLLFLGQAPKFTIQNHSLALRAPSLIITSLLLFILLLGIWAGYSGLVARSFKIDFPESLLQDFLTYLPLLYLILFPALLFHYLDSDDLIVRLNILLWTILFSIFYLKAISVNSFLKKGRFPFQGIAKKVSSFPIKKKLLILFLTSLHFYNIGSVLLTSSGQTFAGDEPHYLLMAHSLLKDGDLNLSNNYANKDYQKIMLAQVQIKPHTAPGTKGQYSFHSPGMAIVLLPFYALGSLFQGEYFVFFIRLGMSVFGALLGLQIFQFAFQEWKNEKLALGIWLFYSFSSPVFFYSLHVYPEIVIALFSLTVFYRLRFSSSLSKTSLIFLGFLLSCFIWFHAIKYVFLVVPLFIYSLWALLKKFKVGSNILYFLAFPFFLTLIYFLLQYTFYGSFSLSSVSWIGPMSPKESLAYIKSIITEIPFRYRWETLVGYFFDQRDGLLLYAPAYFFAFLGCVEILKKKFRTFLLILFLTAPYVLNSALVTQRTSYAPQARPLVSVSWALAIFVGYFLAFNVKKIFTLVFYMFAFIGIFFVFLLLKTPQALYQLTTVGTSDRFGSLFVHLSNLHFFLPQYLPSYLKIDNSRWFPNFIWIGAVLLFVGLYLVIKKHDFRLKMPAHLVLTGLGILLLFFWLCLFPRTVLMNPTNTQFPSGQKMTFYSIGRVVQMKEPGKFLLPRDNRTYIFHFTSWQKIKRLSLSLGSLEGVFDVEVRVFDLVLFKGEVSHRIESLQLSSPPFYRYKNTNLYRLSIYVEKKSGTIAFSKPFLFSILPVT